MIKSKITFFTLIAILIVIAVIILDLCDSEYKFHDILVESHGLVFDLIVFGVLIAIYDKVKSKSEKIERYREEIRDYAFWDSDEANFRIKGILRRLIDLNADKVDLSHCFLKSFPTPMNMSSWNFSATYLENGQFIIRNMSNSIFDWAIIKDSGFVKVNLSNANFSCVVFNNVIFRECIFKNTDLSFAYVQSPNWFNELKQRNNGGVEELINDFQISENSVKMDGVEYYQILSKDSRDKHALDRDKMLKQNTINQTPEVNYEMLKNLQD